MTAQQIAQKLRQAGFIANLNTEKTLVFVTLKNRQISVGEVSRALGRESEQVPMWHTPAGVTVMGLEE